MKRVDVVATASVEDSDSLLLDCTMCGPVGISSMVDVKDDCLAHLLDEHGIEFPKEMETW